MNSPALIGIAAAYLGLLFWTAYRVDAGGMRWLRGKGGGAAIYVLSLAVYCTAWTFFGSVGRAAEAGIGFLPTYVGPIVVYLLFTPVLAKILHVAKSQNITSIADFISSRYGKCEYLAGIVAVVALAGVVPYIALQLKAVAMAFDLTSAYLAPAGPGTMSAPAQWWLRDSSFWISVAMALFVMLFATRTADASAQRAGLVASIALESAVKLLVFLTLGLFISYSLFDNIGDIIARAAHDPGLAKLLDLQPALDVNFFVMTLLSGLAIICLPRQFHVTFVENTDETHLKAARLGFPAYLVLINLFVIPVAVAGELLLGGNRLSPDSYVLAIPIATDHASLVVAVFVGGLAAATGMIIVETLSLATMLCNDIAIPILARIGTVRTDGTSDMQPFVKRMRRGAIFLVLVSAYAYVRLVGDAYTLVGIGLVSFVGVAQFAPAIIGGIYWPRAGRIGAIAGLLAGSGVWAYTLLLPGLAASGWVSPSLIEEGPFHLRWLAPHSLFGWGVLDVVTHATVWSLSANVLAFVAGSLISKPSAAEIPQAIAFLRTSEPKVALSGTRVTSVRVRELFDVVSRFVDRDLAQAELSSYLESTGASTAADAFVCEDALIWAERMIGRAVGSPMSKTVVASLRRNRINIDDAIGLLTDATDLLSSNWERFRETLENINQGILMFDRDLRLAVWNSRALALLELPENLATSGTPFEELVRFNVRRGEYGPGDPEEQVRTSLERAGRMVEHRFERTRPNGVVLEVYGKPLPSGGFVTTFADITERKKSELALKIAYEELESRVEERTRELKESKDRFKEMLESSSDWYWETDDQHRFIYISDRYFELTHMRRENVIGKARWELRDDEHSVVVDAVILENRRQMERHLPFRNVVYRIGSSEGEMVIRTSGKPFFSEAGKFLGYRGTATDVTAAEKAEQELFRSEKLAALGSLVAGVAHEINTPIGIGLTAATYLEEKTSGFHRLIGERQLKRSDLNAYLEHVGEISQSLTNNLRRAAQLVKSFKQVAVDQSTDQVRQFDLLEYLNEIVMSLGPRMKRTQHSLTIECPQGLLVTCNPGAVSQIVTNLIINSLTHGFEHKEQGHIAVSATPEKRNVTIVYKDDGKGISPANMRHLFQPFFTTKRGEGGSGLGLHIIYNLVTQSLRGRIDVSSTEGCGVQFTIWLPDILDSSGKEEGK